MWTVVATGAWKVKMSIAVIWYATPSVALSAKFWAAVWCVSSYDPL